VRGTVANTTAVNSRVKTSGKDAHAGIGGGAVYPGGTVAHTTAVNSRVKTSGKDAHAGIGRGAVLDGGTVAHTTALNSYVNDILENSGSISNDQLLCQKADLRVLTANCSSRTEFLDALDFSNSNACPVNAATVSTGVTASTPTTASTAAKESTPTTASTAAKESTPTTASTAAKESTPTIASTAATASTPIKINDAEDLAKIGRHPDYPLDGTYKQTANIVVTKDYQSIGNDTHPFTGEYDGQRRTISGLSDCLVDTLKQGNISRLGFTDTHINSTKTTGLAACTANGTVSDIRAENVHISTSGDNAYAGIGAGLVGGGGMVTNTTVVNSTVETSGENAHAGIGGGVVFGTVANSTAVNSTVETSGTLAHAGIGGGDVSGTVANTTAVNSTVETSGTLAHAGIGGGIV
ncbi:hypothetical protein J7438_25635, partial [Thalassotalea sp. G20_0]|uniref:hypothetical protein n=1 Tax=Thalassotalea sp. G20_0 TaxID=2821093 RepID=UPI001ADA0568